MYFCKYLLELLLDIYKTFVPYFLHSCMYVDFIDEKIFLWSIYLASVSVYKNIIKIYFIKISNP